MKRKKIGLVFLGIILLTMWCTAQTASMDGHVVETTAKERLKRLLERMEAEHRTDPDNTIRRAREALEILKGHPDPEAEALTYQNKAWAHIFAGQPNEALESAFAALDLAKTHRNQSVQATALSIIGIGYFYTARYNRALAAFDDALAVAAQLKDKRVLAYVYTGQGNVYDRLGQYSLSVSCYFKARQVHEEYGNSIGMAGVYNNLANVYMKISAFNKALSNYHEALKIFEKAGNKRALSSIHNNMGGLYFAMRRHKEALDSLTKALALQEELEMRPHMIPTLANIADVNCSLFRLEQAGKFARRALTIAEEVNDRYSASHALLVLGRAARLQNRYKEAEAFTQRSLKLAKELDMKELEIGCYQEFSIIHTGLKDYKSADSFHIKYQQEWDRIFNDNVNRKITEIQTRFQSEKKEKEIQILKQETHIQELEMKKQRFFSLFLGITLALSVGVILLLVNRYRLGNRTHLDIQQKNKQLTDAYNELEKVHRDIDKLGVLIPICSTCKSIRDDDGYWHQLESYIRDHSDAEVSHGICPACMDEYSPDSRPLATEEPS